MLLHIENCTDRRFIIYLIKFIQDYVKSSINVGKTFYLNNYIQSIPQYKIKSRKTITCKEIIFLGIYNLICYRVGNSYYITVDRNKKIPETFAKLYDACRLINYGTLSVNGYPIFTEAFNYVLNNISFLYMSYQGGY